LWQVPKDLTLNGNEETFTIEIIFETRTFYGTVTGKRQITVTRN